jgi:hypothetical protein
MTGFRSPQEPGGLTGLENRSWYVGEKLSHAVAGDQRASAYVCIPKGVQGPLPAVFCHHQHAGTSVWERASSPGDSSHRHLGQRLSGPEFGVGHGHGRAPRTQGDQHLPGRVLQQLLVLGTFTTSLELRTSAALCVSCLIDC